MTGVKFEFIPIRENNEPLVNLGDYPFILEPSYFNQGLSEINKMYIRKGVAEKLLAIQKELQLYTFKIWDGYRSRDVQNNIYQKFWKELQKEHPDWDERKLKEAVAVFVTEAKDPNRIPPHETGGAIDLTLVGQQGKEIDMGTAFDYFGPEAASLYYEETGKNDLIKNNRRILREAMIKYDFRSDKDEWWHFDFGNQIWAAAYNKPFAIYGESTL